jgi:fatty acid desaturase
VLLPVYIAAYKFENKVYQVMLNGQTGAIAGQKPVAWWKIWLVIAAMLSPGLCLGLVSLPLLLAGGIGLVPLVIGGILLVAGLVGAFFLYQKAVASEAA